MAKSPMTTPTSNHIAVKYQWFRQNIGKEVVIKNINPEKQNANIFTKGYKVEYMSGLGKFYALGKPSYERKCRNKWNLQP